MPVSIASIVLKAFYFLYLYQLHPEERAQPEGKRPLRRPRRKWIDNIKMDLPEIGLSVVDWIGLAQDRCRWSSCELGNEHSGFIKMLGIYRVAVQLVASRGVYSAPQS
jgi:hypothetical protein